MSPRRKNARQKHYLFEELGTYLRDARLRRGLTQKEVADALGFSVNQFVSNFERGVVTPPLRVLRQLMDLYGLSHDELMSVVVAAEEIRISDAFEKAGILRSKKRG